MSTEETLDIQFQKLHEDAIIPTRGTPYSAGFDLYALKDTIVVGGGGNVIVPTGIAIQLPPGTYGRIAMRSGLAVKQHLSVSAGVIDIDYTGEVGVVVFCTKLFDIQKLLTQEISAELCNNRYSGPFECDREWVEISIEHEETNFDVKESSTAQILMQNNENKLFPMISPHFYMIKKGEKFAQLIPEKISYAESRVVTQFDRNYSQHLGYGSTGTGFE